MTQPIEFQAFIMRFDDWAIQHG